MVRRLGQNWRKRIIEDLTSVDGGQFKSAEYDDCTHWQTRPSGREVLPSMASMADADLAVRKMVAWYPLQSRLEWESKSSGMQITPPMPRIT